METFDEEVLQIAETDPFLQEFARTANFSKKKYFIRTKLHKELETWLFKEIDGELQDVPTCISGIKGIGKTTTLLYCVLQRLKNKKNDLHYIDLNRFQHLQESKLRKFEKIVCDFESKSALIIDHATLDNVSVTKQIMEIVQDKQLQVIVMETGFTASIKPPSFDIGKAYQLDEVEFTSIWNGSLEKAKDCRPLLEQGKDVYSSFAKNYIITPRLLNFVLHDMLHMGKTLDMAYHRYELHLKNEITEFSVREDNELYSEFNLHTRFLLHHVQPNGDCIFPYADLHQLRVAINIFDVQEGRVTKDDLENDIRFKEFNFAEGDGYGRISHLIPQVAVFWQKKLPYDFETILTISDNQIFQIMFQYGGARKEFEELLVHFQREQKYAICPGEIVCQTKYEPSATYCEFKQVSTWFTRNFSSDFYMSPTKEELSEIDTEFQGCDKNVAKCAILLRKGIEQHKDRDILLYPRIGNLMGVNYFLYFPLLTPERGVPPEKMPKLQKQLLLVQVSAGATHTGETIGKALNVVEEVFSDMDITIHVVIIIARNDTHPYRLLKSKLENVSIINLATNMNVVNANRLLYRLTKHLANMSL